MRISADASQRLAAAVRHIDSQFSEDIDSASLASGCGMSDRTVTEIAVEVGFEDSNFFALEFRKLRDHPPTVYRKIWQE